MNGRLRQDVRISTQDVGDADRLDYWRERVGSLLIDVECQRPPEQGLDASLRFQDFGLFRMATIQANAHAVARSGHSIRHDARDSIFACLMLQGRGFSHQGVDAALHGPGDVVMYDTARPYGHGFPGDMSMAVLDIPRSLFERHVGRWAARGLVRIESSRVMAGWDALAVHRTLTGGAGRENDEHLASGLLEWLHSLWQAHSGESTASKSTLCSLWRAKAFIEAHLAEDELDSALVGRAVGLSSRQLARLFEREGLSVSRYVWGRRLERCRIDLQDPALRHLSVSELAFRWGFNHMAHFCRCYKRRFEETPSQTRSAAWPVAR
ncbi:helix-turn-helix domain-containing protein [uncultured Aquitalea sp.]|uniref:helix-turn-helix domain-containing protein n=1 Tax=uncultured Aquitalea sp. TaxID=540272 RepID=UPI0025E4D466|nr:helix-turn-helix domain-containing protein [uncultured Aquitalea sp.]